MTLRGYGTGHLGGLADTWCRANDTAAADPGGLSLALGRNNKLDTVQFPLLRFSLTHPSAETILSWELEVWTHASSAVWPACTLAVGLLVPDGLWDGPNAFALSNYPTMDTYPIPTDNSHNINSGVLFGDAWIGTTPLGVLNPSTRLRLGEGLLGNQLAGTAATLENYYDTHGSQVGLVLAIFEDEVSGTQRTINPYEEATGFFRPWLRIDSEVLNAAPTIDSTPVTSAQVGVAYSYDVDATDPDLDTLTYTLEGTPPTGMTIDSGSGVISWLPVPGQEGSHPVTVRATDPGALFDEQNFNIDVDANLAYIALGDIERLEVESLGDITRDETTALGDITRDETTALGDLEIED